MNPNAGHSQVQLGSIDLDQFIRDPIKKAKSLVRKITHSGETDLAKEDLVELKKLCMVCKEDVMISVYKECLVCLRKSHSQVRVSTVKLIDYLFRKSHLIRKKLLDDFDDFLELSLAITQRPKIKLQLPPPKKFAALLRELTAKLIHKWHAEFGAGYDKLRYAHRFLSEHKLIDFSQFRVLTHEQLIKQQKLAEAKEKILTRSIENRLKELGELKPDINQLLAQIESLIDILVPSEVSSEVLSDVNNVEERPEQSARQHGFANLSQTIQIEFEPYVEVKRNEDNKQVVESLKDLKKELIRSKLVKLVAIEKTLIKRSEEFVSVLKEIIDIKTRATNVVLKLGELEIVNDDFDDCAGPSTLDSDSDGDGDFEEVGPKEGLESYIPKSKRKDYGLEPVNLRELARGSSISLIDEGFTPEHAPNTSNPDLNESSNLFPSCNVRLESGKLCPRRDKLKCPFHGVIIPRDLNGVPLNEEDRIREENEAKASRGSRAPEWQDPQLLSEIREATGIDLTMPTRNSKGQISPKKKLANTKTCDLTPKQRLQKRLKLLLK